jgi:hypothetical protein
MPPEKQNKAAKMRKNTQFLKKELVFSRFSLDKAPLFRL